jgi:hypothetical protein
MLAGGGRGLWTTLGGLLPPSPTFLELWPSSAFLWASSSAFFAGLLLPVALHLLPSSTDIVSQRGVVPLHLLMFFLDTS